MDKYKLIQMKKRLLALGFTKEEIIKMIKTHELPGCSKNEAIKNIKANSEVFNFSVEIVNKKNR